MLNLQHKIADLQLKLNMNLKVDINTPICLTEMHQLEPIKSYRKLAQFANLTRKEPRTRTGDSGERNSPRLKWGGAAAAASRHGLIGKEKEGLESSLSILSSLGPGPRVRVAQLVSSSFLSSPSTGSRPISRWVIN